MKRMFSQRSDGIEPWLNEEGKEFLRELFDSYVNDSLEKLNKLKEFVTIPSYEIRSITSVCNFLEYFISP